jgi:hypothetical protein
MSTPPPDIYDILSDDFIELLIAKGIHAILYRMRRDGTPDKTKNLLHGYPVGNIKVDDQAVDSEEFQDQLRGGMYKTSVGGAIKPGNVTFDTYFAPSKGKPPIEGVENSMAITPQFLLVLARKKDADTLEGFYASGVNFGGGLGLDGTYGKAVKSGMKFDGTGKPLIGYDEVGEISMTDYTAGAA